MGAGSIMALILLGTVAVEVTEEDTTRVLDGPMIKAQPKKKCGHCSTGTKIIYSNLRIYF